MLKVNGKNIRGPSSQKFLDTEPDLECLGTQPTPKNLWKIWKADAKERMRRKRLPEKRLGQRKEETTC